MKINDQIFFRIYRDRVRTVVNVLGDAIGAGIVDHLSQSELQQIKPASPSTGTVTCDIELTN